MTLNPEHVIVRAGGKDYSGWERVTWAASIKEAARQFALETTEGSLLFEQAWSFPPGTPIQIFSYDELVIDGYVNRYAPRISATDHRITITGRSKAQDFVDCAAMHEPGYWENKTPLEIGQDLDKFGVGITADVPLEPIPYFQLYQGETAFEALERAIRHQGVVAMGDPAGIRLTNAKSAKRHSGGLYEGHNIKVAHATLSDDERFSEHTVKGQGRHGRGERSLRIKERWTDTGVKRYRPRIIILEGDTDPKRALKRAEVEANRSQGLSVRAEIITQGWRDDNGKIWTPNHLVYVFSPSLKIDGDLLIERVEFEQEGTENTGSLAKLSLVNERAYQGQKAGRGGKGGKGGAKSDNSAAEWNE